MEIKPETITLEEFAAGLSSFAPPHIVEDMQDNWQFLQHFRCEGYNDLSRFSDVMLTGPYADYGDGDIHWVDRYLARSPARLTEWLDTADLTLYKS